MALINCPECNTQVSSAAASCPKCGYPIADAVQKARESSGRDPRNREDRHDWRRLGGIVVAIIAVIVVVIVLTQSAWKDDGSTDAAEQKEAQSPIEREEPPTPPAPMPTEAEIEEALTTVEPIKNAVPTKGANEDLRDSWQKALNVYRKAFPPVEATERFLSKRVDYPKAMLVREYLDRIDYCYPLQIRYISILTNFSHLAQIYDVPEAKRGNRWAIDVVRTMDKMVEDFTTLREAIGDDIKKARTPYCVKSLTTLHVEIGKQIDKTRAFRPFLHQKYMEQMIQAEGGYVTTARALRREFQANEIAALQKYKGRRIMLRGKLAGVDADFMDQPSVQLRTGNQFMPVYVKGFSVEQAATFRKGQDIYVVCQNVSEMAGSVFCESVPFQF